MTREVRLDSLFRIGSSKRVLKTQWRDSGVPFYRGREITKLSQDGFVDNELFIDESLYADYAEKYGTPGPGDIVVTAIGTIGNSYVVKHGDKFYFKDASVLWLKRDSDVVSEYIDYWLKSPLMRNQLDEGNGATVDTLTIQKLQSLVVQLPPISEQKRIVAILDQAFAEIDKARALTEQNLKNARELFESTLQQVFSQRGEGWTKFHMSEVCGITSTLVDPKERKYQDSPHIGAGNIMSGTGELVDVKTASEEGLISGKFVFDDSMVLYSKIRPYLMKVCKPNFTGLCSADIYPLAPIEGRLDREYLFYLLLTKEFTDYAIAGSGRAGMPKVNRTHLFKFSTYLPNIEVQVNHARDLNEVFKQSQRLERIYGEKIQKLKTLKASLLQKAFSGELTQDLTEAAA